MALQGTIWTRPVYGEEATDITDGKGDDLEPGWSPVGSKMTYVQDGVLWTAPVDSQGEITGSPEQITDEIADNISWTGDSENLVYISPVWDCNNCTKNSRQDSLYPVLLTRHQKANLNISINMLNFLVIDK